MYLEPSSTFSNLAKYHEEVTINGKASFVRKLFVFFIFKEKASYVLEEVQKLSARYFASLKSK